ncbi:MAG: rhodanese-like domain-containing protein [Burkholderiaceae bacterium]
MDHLLPAEAAELLSKTPDALFIDCRSDAEYFFVGHPVGAVHVAWLDGADWEVNPHFVGEIRRLAGHSVERPVILICRSGRRSADAGMELEKSGFQSVVNVSHGFEGDLNEHHQRGKVNGWRFDGLPWEQL